MAIVFGLTGGLTCFYFGLGLVIVGEEGGDLFLSFVGFYFITLRLIGFGGSIVFYLIVLMEAELSVGFVIGWISLDFTVTTVFSLYGVIYCFLNSFNPFLLAGKVTFVSNYVFFNGYPFILPPDFLNLYAELTILTSFLSTLFTYSTFFFAYFSTYTFFFA